MENLYRKYVVEYFQDKSNQLGYMESWKIASSNEPEDFSNFQRFFVKRMTNGEIDLEISDKNVGDKIEMEYNKCFESFKTFCGKIKVPASEYLKAKKEKAKEEAGKKEDADMEDFEDEIIARFGKLKIAPFNDEDVFFEEYRKWIENQLKYVEEATHIIYVETIRAYFESVIQKLTSRQEYNEKYNLARGILNFIIEMDFSTVFIEFQRFWLQQVAAIDVHSVKKMSAKKVGQKFEEYFQIWQEDVGKQIGEDLKPLDFQKDAEKIFLAEYNKWRFEQTSPDAHAILVNLHKDWIEWVKEEEKPVSLLVEVAKRLKEQGADRYEKYFREIGALDPEAQDSDDDDSNEFPAFELHNSVFSPEFDEYISHMYVAFLDDSGDLGSIKLLSDALKNDGKSWKEAFSPEKDRFMERVEKDWKLLPLQFYSDEDFEDEMKERLEEYDKIKKRFLVSRFSQFLFPKYAMSLKNKMAHQGRKAAKNVSLDEVDQYRGLFDIFSNPEKRYIMNEFFNQLPAPEKRMVLLTIAGYTQREIGKEFGIDKSTVSRRLKKAGVNPRNITKKAKKIPKKKIK